MNKLKENFKQDKIGFAANVIGIILCLIVIPFIGKEGYSFMQSLQAHSDFVAVNEYESIKVNNTAENGASESNVNDLSVSKLNKDYTIIEERFIVTGWSKEDEMWYGNTLDKDDNGKLFFEKENVMNGEEISIGDTVTGVYLDDKYEENLFLFVVKDDENMLVSRMESE